MDKSLVHCATAGAENKAHDSAMGLKLRELRDIGLACLSAQWHDRLLRFDEDLPVLVETLALEGESLEGMFTCVHILVSSQSLAFNDSSAVIFVAHLVPE
jgi:hypothetical protein